MIRELEDIRIALIGKNLSEVSRASGVNYDRIWRIMNKPDHMPAYNTVKDLSDWLDKEDG